VKEYQEIMKSIPLLRHLHAHVVTLVGVASVALLGTIQASITTNRRADGVSYSLVVTNGFDSLATRLAAPDGWQWLSTESPIVLTRQKPGLN